MINKNNKVFDVDVIEGYTVGNLTVTVQAVPEKDTGRLIKGVFCTLWVKNSEDKEEKIDFVFALDSVPEFKRHIVSMINEAISLKVGSKKKVIKKKTKKDEK